jgi:hypothetical protein
VARILKDVWLDIRRGTLLTCAVAR